VICEFADLTGLGIKIWMQDLPRHIESQKDNCVLQLVYKNILMETKEMPKIFFFLN
jgi:hypothetical protein